MADDWVSFEAELKDILMGSQLADDWVSDSAV